MYLANGANTQLMIIVVIVHNYVIRYVDYLSIFCPQKGQFFLIEPQHDKTNKMICAPAMTLISLSMRSV